MADPAEPLQRRAQGQQALVNLVAGVHAIGDDAGTGHLVGGFEIHQAGGVIQVPDGDVHAPLSEHVIKGGKPLRLLFRSRQIGTVCGGKVAEQALGVQPGQSGNLRTDIRVTFRYLKTDAAHAGVHGEVEPCGQLCRLCCLRQGQRVLHAVNRGPDSLPDGGGVSLRRGITQQQNGFCQSGLPQFHGF